MERTLTSKGLATRQRIVEGAAAEIRRRGAADVSLDDIRAVTSTSKSQLFHYFPEGRDQLLLAVARLESDRVLSDQQPYLDNLTSWQAWAAWRDTVVEHYRKQGRQCPLSVVVGQLGSDSADRRAVVSELQRSWQNRLATGVRAMQAAGEIGLQIDPDGAANALVAGIQGGAITLIATNDLGQLTAALDFTLDHLRASVG
jgi:AcrR family transcriptional regulator